jgi:hypothetical protein
MIRPFALAALAAALLAAPALSAPPTGDATLLGATKDWQAFTSGSGSDKICYAMAKPRASDPRKIKRDAIYFMVTDWPSRKTKSEPEAVPGYQYKDGSTVTAQLGGEKFEFFTQNDDGTGAAWIRKRGDELRFVELMKKGGTLVVSGTSKRGTATKDTYQLAGFAEALDRIHSSCGL